MSRTSRPGDWILISICLIFLLTAISTAFQKPDISLLWRRVVHRVPLLAPYEATLSNCNYKDVVDRSYDVFLHKGSSLEDHIKALAHQVNLTTRIKHNFPETDHHGLYYFADDIDDEALEAIRADVLVDFLECGRALQNVVDVDMVIEDVYDEPRTPPDEL